MSNIVLFLLYYVMRRLEAKVWLLIFWLWLRYGPDLERLWALLGECNSCQARFDSLKACPPKPAVQKKFQQTCPLSCIQTKIDAYIFMSHLNLKVFQKLQIKCSHFGTAGKDEKEWKDCFTSFLERSRAVLNFFLALEDWLKNLFRLYIEIGPFFKVSSI